MEQKVRDLFEIYINKEMEQLILSKPSGREAAVEREPVYKLKLRPVLLKKELVYQASEYRGTKVFHNNYNLEELMGKLEEWIGTLFLQAELFHPACHITVLVSKKGKTTVKCRRCAADQTLPDEKRLAHNRPKAYLIPEGSKVPFLLDLGIFTDEGKIVRAKYDKYRQINRFLEFIEDVLPELRQDRELHIIDFGCGKSYLTFAMYYYLTEVKGFRVRITGLDLKADVISRCNALKERYGYDGLTFLQGDIASYEGSDSADMVVTLHACDTATDAALQKAVQWKASVILSVPCCQHELNRQIENPVLKPVLKYGIIKERVAALITDAIRADLLELEGYQVQLLEFIDMEHTPKNILIRAVRQKTLPLPALKESRKKELEQCLAGLQLSPALYRMLHGMDCQRID